ITYIECLIPLFIFIGGGCTMSLTYLGRLALRNPDVCWDKKNNPEPWNKLGPNDQYKNFKNVYCFYGKHKKKRCNNNYYYYYSYLQYFI
uniref:Cytochrome c oxidase subunit NDUFA4 n=1 Tax=Sinocyclocheilus grahami TaxID=75366 RepID=A0A672RU27_SINGR